MAKHLMTGVNHSRLRRRRDHCAAQQVRRYCTITQTLGQHIQAVAASSERVRTRYAEVLERLGR